MFIKVTLNSFQGNLEASHVISNEIETKMAKIEGSMTFQQKAATNKYVEDESILQKC